MKGSIRKRGKFHPAPAAIIRKKSWFKRAQAKNESETASNDKIQEIRRIARQGFPQIRFKELAGIWLKSYAEINLKQSTLARYRHVVWMVNQAPTFGVEPPIPPRVVSERANC